MRFWLIVISLALVASSLPARLESPTARAADEVGKDMLETFQGYLDPAPQGMDVRYAWTLPGGRGENVRIVDIEFNWNPRHNDLARAVSDAVIVVKGVLLPDAATNDANVNHGTAVLGELVAADDGVGVTGIAHRARIGMINPLTAGTVPNAAEAVNLAASVLSPGDVIVLEQQSIVGPRYDPFTQRGLVPIEFEPAVFAAIKKATSAGIVVVESAGNGFEDLDHPAYEGAFDRGKRDSGAIIVGAGLPEGGVFGAGPDRSRMEESNYGSCVDLQGWGRFVVTCGYGQLRREQGENNWYTDVFGFTSAATAMVAGAAALVQSILKERGEQTLKPTDLRRLLISTGTPQTGDLGKRIGPRPNLRAAIEALDKQNQSPDPEIDEVKFKKSGGKLVVDGQNFTAGDSIIEVDGAAITRLKYPSDFISHNGLTTRLMTKGDVSSMIPPGVEVSITVFTPSTNKRSEAFPFRR